MSGRDDCVNIPICPVDSDYSIHRLAERGLLGGLQLRVKRGESRLFLRNAKEAGREADILLFGKSRPKKRVALLKASCGDRPGQERPTAAELL